MINATRITWLNGALNEGELIKVKVIVRKTCIYIYKYYMYKLYKYKYIVFIQSILYLIYM